MLLMTDMTRFEWFTLTSTLERFVWKCLLKRSHKKKSQSNSIPINEEVIVFYGNKIQVYLLSGVILSRCGHPDRLKEVKRW